MSGKRGWMRLRPDGSRRGRGLLAVLRGYATFAVMVALCGSAWAQTFEAGRHYEVLPVPVETAGEGAVEVVEVFSYACVHCYSFDPLIDAWQRRQPAHVRFERVPATFNPIWEQLARAYFAAEALGVTEALHMPLFEAIHVHRVDIRDDALLARIFRRYGDVEPDAFEAAFKSFGVDTHVRQAGALSRAYRITSVPTLVVAGKYRIEADMAGSPERMLAVADFLVEKEQSAAGVEGSVE